MSDKGGSEKPGKNGGKKPPKGGSPSGVHTQGGGGDVLYPDPQGVHTQGGGGDVVNQQKLVLDPSIFECVSPEERHALKIIQLEFAQAVSLASAAAYGKLIAEFRRTRRPVTKPA